MNRLIGPTGLVLGTLLGCQDHSQPIVGPASDIQAEFEEARVAAELDDGADLENGGKFGEPLQPMSTRWISQSLQAKLERVLPNRAETIDRFTRTIEALRRKDQWLNLAMEDPWGTSMVRPNDGPPGPSMLDLARDEKRMLDLIRDEYVSESAASDDEKKGVVALYEKSVLRLLADRSVDAEAQSEIYDRLLQNEIEPLVLFMNLKSRLTDEYRLSTSRKVLQGLRSRRCGPWTTIAMTRVCNMEWAAFPVEERRQLTLRFLEAIPEMLHEISQLDDWKEQQLQFVAYLRVAYLKLNHHARIKLVEDIIDLFESEDCPKACDAYFMHSVVSRLHFDIARYARGGDFIQKLTAQQYEDFSDHSEKDTLHLMSSFALRPDDVFALRRIIDAELKSGDAPYSVEQLCRVAQTMAYDYESVIDVLCYHSQPRWGGNRRKMLRLIEQTVDLALIEQTGNAVYDKPLNTYLSEYGLFGNLTDRLTFPANLNQLRERLFAPPPDSSIEGLGDRLTMDMFTLILRLAWDSSDLETVSKLLRQHGESLNEAWLHHRRLSVDWLWAFDTAYQDAEVDRASLKSLHEELIVGDEDFDDARFQRIEDALAKLVPHAKRRIQELSTEIQELKSEKEPDPITSVDQQDAEQPETPWEPGTRDPVLSWVYTELEGEEEYKNLALQIRSWTLLHKGLTRLSKVATDYEQGKAVEILQGHATDWIATGHGVVGRYSTEIRVNVHNQDSYLLFEFPIRFQLPFQVEMTVRRGQCDADPYGIALFAGPVATGALSSEASGRSLRFSPGYPMIMQDRLPLERLADNYFHQERLVPVPGRAVMRIEMTKNSTQSYVNDKLITETNFPNNPLGIIGFGRIAGDEFTGVPNRESKYAIESVRVTPR
ncbi:MAG: hypothetical protein AAGJ40_05720 [Planctomycetota bacterium]